MYDKLPAKYRDYFKEHGIPFSPTYTEDQLTKLFELNEAIRAQKAKGAGISESKKRKDGKNEAFWQYLSGLQIVTTEPGFLEGLEQPNDYAVFCGKNCKGNLNTAIDGIDKFVYVAQDAVESNSMALSGVNVRLQREMCKLVETGKATLDNCFLRYPLEPPQLRKLQMELKQHERISEVIAKLITLNEERLKLTQLEEELQIASGFIRDVNALVSRSKDKKVGYRKFEKWKNMPGQKPLKNPEQYSDVETETSRVLSKLGPEVIEQAGARLIRRQKPLYPAPPSAPSFTFHGNCILCHRPALFRTYYCDIHTKPKAGEKKPDKQKSEKDRIKTAFSNLGYLLVFELNALYKYNSVKGKFVKTPHINDRDNFDSQCGKQITDAKKEHNLTDRDIFIEKAMFLSGWGMHHPKHKSFYSELETIEKSIIGDNSNSEPLHQHIDLLNRVIPLTRKHNHTRKFFPKSQGLISTSMTEDDLLKVQNEVVAMNLKSLLSPTRFVDEITGMSIFSLIRLAALKKYEEVVNEAYQPDLLIKSHYSG